VVAINQTKQRIMKLVSTGEPYTIAEISQRCNISWATAKTHLLELSQEGKINVKKCGKNWLIWKTATSRITCSSYLKEHRGE
jgi:predicted ArsR family transcriptional regulator